MDCFKNLRGRQPHIQNEEDHFLSAVLLPLVEKEGQYSILFEVRSNSLNRQPGEVCFPGGKIEKDEMGSPHRTVLREAAEELGIEASQINLIGPLDYLVTPPGTLIYPFVGKILRPEEIKPNRAEVEQVFCVPVDFFIQKKPGKSACDVATRYGPDFPFDRVSPALYGDTWQKRWSFAVYYYEYGGHFIWGLTARILQNFIKLCQRAGVSPDIHDGF